MQAEQISVWVDYKNLRVVIRNASVQPIYEVRLFAVPRGQVAISIQKFWEVIPPPSASFVLPIVPAGSDGEVTPDNEVWWEPSSDGMTEPNENGTIGHPVRIAMEQRRASKPNQAIPNGAGARVSIWFRDEAGKWWRRDGDLGLREDEAPKP